MPSFQQEFTITDRQIWDFHDIISNVRLILNKHTLCGQNAEFLTIQQLVPLGIRRLRNLAESASASFGIWTSSDITCCIGAYNITIIDMGRLGSFQTIDASGVWRVCGLTVRNPERNHTVH